MIVAGTARTVGVPFRSHVSDQDPLDRVEVELLDDRLLNPQPPTP